MADGCNFHNFYPLNAIKDITFLSFQTLICNRDEFEIDSTEVIIWIIKNCSNILIKQLFYFSAIIVLTLIFYSYSTWIIEILKSRGKY